ncbi:MAG: hypothetical protein AAF658_21555, partial [Myxococcota bacterium]
MNRSTLLLLVIAIASAIGSGCAKRQTTAPGRVPNQSAPPEAKNRGKIPKKERPPEWVVQMEFEGGKLCGLGVAGAGFFEDSPYPKQLSRERAIRNLAGILSTRIQEAIIDKETTYRGQSTRLARLVTVDEELIAKVDASSDTEYWRDIGGWGPFAQKSFTYAKACIDVHTAAELMRVSDQELNVAAAGSNRIDPDTVPTWIDRRGEQPGGRLCAVGFSLPTFHPDKTFEAVVEDVRVQLAKVIETLVSSYYEELTTARGTRTKSYQELMTVASTQAVSNGVIVTDYWYDERGIGPFGRRRTTYGWGCVYPVDVLSATLNAVE